MSSRSRRRKKRKILNECEIDSTSLLDILVILLVFLLSGYSSSELNIKLNSQTQLAQSKTKKIAKETTTIQVNQQGFIIIDDKEVGIVKSNNSTIPPLQEYLKTREVKSINIILDENLTFQVLEDIMHTASLIGKTDFKLIVRGQ